MHNTHTVLPPVEISAGRVEAATAAAYRKERRYKNRYEPGRGSEKRGNKGWYEQKGRRNECRNEG